LIKIIINKLNSLIIMDNKNINKNTTNTASNLIARPSSAVGSQRAATSAIQPGNRASAIAAQLQNSPQVGDANFTRLMRLLGLKQEMSAQECVELFFKIDNKNLQRQAYAKIVESLASKPEELSVFKQQVQDPAVLEEQEAIARAKIEQQQAIAKAKDPSISIDERYAAARSIKDVKKQEKAFCGIVESVPNFFIDAPFKQLQEALEDLSPFVKDAVLCALMNHKMVSVFIQLKAADLIVDLDKRDDALCQVALCSSYNSLDAAKMIQNADKKHGALYQVALHALYSQYPDISKCLDIAKLIHSKELQQQVLLAIFEYGSKKVNFYNSKKIVDALSLLRSDLKNPDSIKELIKNYLNLDVVKNCATYRFLGEEFDVFVRLIGIAFQSVNDSDLKNELLSKYFEIYTKMTHNTSGCEAYLDQHTRLIQSIWDVAGTEDKSTILLKVANSLYGQLEGWGSYQVLLGEIHNCAPRELQKEIAYLLLKKLMRVTSSIQDIENNYFNNLSAYEVVLNLFLPVCSVYDADIDELIENVLSQAPDLDGQTWTTSDGRNIFWEKLGQVYYNEMCTAVLNLYMPSEQISAEKKNLMIEATACNQSFSKDFRERVINDYIQDEILRDELLAMIDLNLIDRRFKKMKLAPRSEDQS
jgi:hypothetical protein